MNKKIWLRKKKSRQFFFLKFFFQLGLAHIFNFRYFRAPGIVSPPSGTQNNSQTPPRPEGQITVFIIMMIIFSSLTRFTLSTKIIKMHTNALKIVPAHVRECHSVRRIRSKPFFPRCAKSMKFSQNTFWISDFFQTGGRTHAS